jgi:cytochrome c biogenesis protein CcdA
MAASGPDMADPVDDEAAERTLGELVADANSEIAELLSLQVQLAKAEIKREVRTAARGSMLFAAAAFIGHLVLILLSVTLGLLLWELTVLPSWAAFLIVTGFYLLCAVILVIIGLVTMRKLSGTPRTKGTLPRTLGVIRRGSATEGEELEPVTAGGRQPAP